MNDVKTQSVADRVYWRNLGELAGVPAPADALDEFAAGAAEQPAFADPVSRRRFLGVVAASVAMASMTSCRKPERKILPFTHRPEGMVPGMPRFYATASLLGGFAVGQLVRSNDGRPTHIEGNPLQAGSRGGASHWMQAHVLDLYDPARSRHAVKGGAEALVGHDHDYDHDHDHAHAHDHDHDHALTFADFLADWDPIAAQLAAKRGAGLHFLLEASASPTLQRVVAKVRAVMPDARFHWCGPFDRDAELDGARIAFGRELETVPALDRADVVVSFDRDFLGVDPDAVRLARDFAAKRKITAPSQAVSRLYVAEAHHSLTGSNADHRFRLPASQIPTAVFALAAELGVDLGDALDPYRGKSFEHRGKNWIAAVARDLQNNRGKSCVLVGARQPAAVHAVVHAINHALGNVGTTVDYRAVPAGMMGRSGYAALATAIDAAQVDTVVCLGTNPVATAPADLDFAARLAKVGNRIHLGIHFDETARLSTWHVPLAHELEAWGDGLAVDGSATIAQPLIAPLFGGKSIIEFLAELIGDDVVEGYQLVRETWQARHPQGFEGWWTKGVHDGVLDGVSAPAEATTLAGADVATAVRNARPAAPPGASGLELNILLDYKVLDGRFANNSWLQELPDPLTKLTWDNAALVSPRTAGELGVGNGDVVTLAAGGRSVDAPIWIVPGHAEHVVSVALGYGRDLLPMAQYMVVARGVGFDANRLRTDKARHVVTGLQVTRTGATRRLVSAQEHGNMEGRALFRESTLAGYRSNPRFAPDESPLAKAAKLQGKTEQDLMLNLWEHRDYSQGPQWGMVIDLNTCTGCSACVVACVSENNIPMVGKDQVAVGREMFWNRLDRYFVTDEGDGADDPQVAHQMVPCMQCENAPCESVCPVNATTHTAEGLNDMVYNRCIGTRYCNNNCPYKVRRFNWLDFTGNQPDTKQMLFNPDVTIRHRGVMEKCTYCVQRINAGKFHAKTEGREVRDGDIRTACEQSCPTQAITFGDIRDASSAVAKLKANDLNYAMLSELNARPRTTYLAKVRNPNPELS